MNVDGQKATLVLETGRIWRLLHGLIMLKLHLLIARVHKSFFRYWGVSLVSFQQNPVVIRVAFQMESWNLTSLLSRVKFITTVIMDTNLLEINFVSVKLMNSGVEDSPNVNVRIVNKMLTSGLPQNKQTKKGKPQTNEIDVWINHWMETLITNLNWRYVS